MLNLNVIQDPAERLAQEVQGRLDNIISYLKEAKKSVALQSASVAPELFLISKGLKGLMPPTSTSFGAMCNYISKFQYLESGTTGDAVEHGTAKRARMSAQATLERQNKKTKK